MPKIAMNSKEYTSGKVEVLGHGCASLAEMEEYCAAFGGAMELVPDDFDFGTFIPHDQRPKQPWIGLDGKEIHLSDKTVKAILNALKDV